jgi:5-methyltetrahydrofolate--homocysteine methyltransferase
MRRKASGSAQSENLCLSDYVPPRDVLEEKGFPATIGFFVISAAFGLEAAIKQHYADDTYSALLLESLAQALTEAASEMYHRRAWEPAGQAQGIRPAFGYPSCPDHNGKRGVFQLLDAAGLGFTLSESAMIIPSSSVCGMYFPHPEAEYFGV